MDSRQEVATLVSLVQSMLRSSGLSPRNFDRGPMRRTILLAVLLMLATTPARAQLGQIILWSGAAADVASTWRGHLYGLHEGNPLIGDKRFAAPAVVIGTVICVDLVARYFERGGHAQAGRNIRIIVGGFHLAGSALNLRAIGQERSRLNRLVKF